MRRRRRTAVSRRFLLDWYTSSQSRLLLLHVRVLTCPSSFRLSLPVALSRSQATRLPGFPALVALQKFREVVSKPCSRAVPRRSASVPPAQSPPFQINFPHLARRCPWEPGSQAVSPLRLLALLAGIRFYKSLSPLVCTPLVELPPRYGRPMARGSVTAVLAL